MNAKDTEHAVISTLGELVGGLAATPGQALLLQSIVNRFAACSAELPVARLAAIHLPHAIATGYGSDTDLANNVAAITTAIYVSLDIMDELVDGDESPLLESSNGPALLAAATTICSLVPELLADLPVSADRRIRLIRCTARALRGISAAELDQAQRRGLLLDVPDAIALAGTKSGTMFAAFAELAAIAAGATAAKIERVREFGWSLGAARQLCADAAELFSAAPAPDLARGLCPLPVAILAASAGPARHREVASVLAESGCFTDAHAALQQDVRTPTIRLATAIQIELVRGGAGAMLEKLALPRPEHDLLATIVNQTSLLEAPRTEEGPK